MKIICYFLSLYFILLQDQCKCQDYFSESKPKDRSCQLILREYEIDDCLADFLYAIVDADSSRSRYPPEIYCYSLQLFEQMPRHCTIIIRPERWLKDLPKDCIGVIEVEGVSFLCCGPIKKNSLFKDIGIDLVKNISDMDTPKYDSLDIKEKFTGWDKSPTALVGVYKGCKQGYSVNLYIDVGKKLEGISIEK